MPINLKHILCAVVICLQVEAQSVPCKQMKTVQLIDSLRMGFASNNIVDIRRELVRRHPIVELTAAYDITKDEAQKEQVILVLSEIKEPQVAGFMRSKLPNQETFEAYVIAAYPAESGDTLALFILNENLFDYPVPSFVKAQAIASFSKFYYWPAVNHLIDALTAPSGNMSDAALKALYVFYPKAKKGFTSPEDASVYFGKLHENK